MNGCNDCCIWIILLMLCCGCGCGCGNNAMPLNNNGGCGCNCILPILIAWLCYGNCCGNNGTTYDYCK